MTYYGYVVSDPSDHLTPPPNERGLFMKIPSEASRPIMFVLADKAVRHMQVFLVLKSASVCSNSHRPYYHRLLGFYLTLLQQHLLFSLILLFAFS